MNIKNIDPALTLLKEFNKATNGSADLIEKLRKQTIFSDGQVSAKYKALGAMLWSISARCEPCIRYYVQQAARLRATEGEIGEFLAVASTMGGCVGEMWALKAFKAFRDLENTEGDSEVEPQCCI
ncbi:MAG: carboxymuconolactone decarboxylase family protein [Oligoflexales bacterium]